MSAFVGRQRFVPATGQLAAGQRAGPGLVGYMGSSGALTTLNVDDSTPAGWDAIWDEGALIIREDDVTVDHYRINGTVGFSGSNPTMTNCIVTAGQGDIFVLTHSGLGYLTVTDTTVIGTPDLVGITYQVNGISSDSGLIAIRCDVSRSGDGIHYTAQPGTPSKISQCYIHDQAFIDEEQHLDGIQGFNNSAGAGSYIIEHTYVAASTSTIGTAMNAASTAGPSTANSEPLVTGTYDNNYFEAGTYHLRINFRHQNTVVTNNTLGRVQAGFEFGRLNVEEPSAITTWTNNRDENGNLISQP